ncbi:MAG: terminase large subunit [Alphaproteobacteria bacterium]|nr:terminase large subunit [Alphaproteobacteria bacterium]
MGLRGPRAKPIPTEASEAPPPAPPWAEDGLSRAERVIRFIETLKLTSGKKAGQLVQLRDWQCAIIRRIYDPIGADDLREVRTALITMGRKNGKTFLSAAIAMAHLCGPEAVARGQICSAAADREQAALIYREMEAFIMADPALRRRTNLQRFHRKIEDFQNGSTYEAMSSDARKAHGLGPALIICDELAQWKGRGLYDNLTTGVGAVAEPLAIIISTQSSDPNHIMSELTGYARQVRDGVIEDPSFAPFVFEVPIEADPWDEQAWRLANPALGDFRSLDEMRKAAELARRMPSREAAFRNLYLNQPIDPDVRFVAGADWKACAGAVDPDTLRGRPCWGGLDLSSTTDLTALVLYFPEDGGAVLPYFWLPEDDLAGRESRDRVPYTLWRNQGHIATWPGRVTDKRAVALRLAELASFYDIREIAFDRWRINDFKKILADEGIDLPLIEFGQGYKDQGPAVDALEIAILGRRLAHGGHPVLTWNVANAAVETDPAGARKITKQRAIARVDGLIALLMAVGLHSRTPQLEMDFERPLVLSA